MRCVAGFLPPSTGIVDSHALMLALQGDAERPGATVVLRAPMIGGDARGSAIELHAGGAESTPLACDCVVNSGGLFAQDVARSIAGLPRGHVAEGPIATLERV